MTIEKVGENQPIHVTKPGKPVAQLSPVPPQDKRLMMGCMEGTAKIVGDIEFPATAASDWNVLRR